MTLYQTSCLSNNEQNYLIDTKIIKIMTIEEIKKYLANYSKEQWPQHGTPDINNDNQMMEILTGSGKELAEQDRDSYRHWDEITIIKQIGDKVIGYSWADGTGDMSIFDKGWEFDWDSVAEYEPYQVTVTAYKLKKL